MLLLVITKDVDGWVERRKVQITYYIYGVVCDRPLMTGTRSTKVFIMQTRTPVWGVIPLSGAFAYATNIRLSQKGLIQSSGNLDLLSQMYIRTTKLE